jgi:hypothetical protein
MGAVGGWSAIALLSIALASCGEPPPPAAPRPAPPPPPPPPVALPPPPPHELTVPPLALTLIDAPTAQVFHIVDELSHWHRRVGSPYEEWAKKEMPLDDGERAMLQAHAKLRAKRRWGSLDQAFSVSVPIEEAVHAAVAKKFLSVPDAENERVLLEHFEGRLGPFLESQQASIAALEARIVSELRRATPLLAHLGRFCEVTETLPVRAVLIPSPAKDEGSGRAVRGTITLEVSSLDDATLSFFHQLAHVVLSQRRGTIAIAAGKCDEAVDDATLEDGLAYAVAPGLVHPGDADALRALVDASANGTLRDPRVRAERLGLSIRPELGKALDGTGGEQTIGPFMPRVCEAWAKVAKP